MWNKIPNAKISHIPRNEESSTYGQSTNSDLQKSHYTSITEMTNTGPEVMKACDGSEGKQSSTTKDLEFPSLVYYYLLVYTTSDDWKALLI